MIADLKTGQKAAWHRLQTAAYRNMSPIPDNRLSFDPEAHVYRYNGDVVPSVTQILDGAGLISEYSLNEYRRQVGQVAHECIAILDDLDLSDVDPVVLPYVLSFIKWLEKSKAKINARELRGYNSRFGYAGTLDLDLTLPGKSWDRGCLYLQRDGSIAKFDPHTDEDDFGFFIAHKMSSEWKANYMGGPR